MDVKGCTQSEHFFCCNVIKIAEIQLILMFMCCHARVKEKFVASICYKVEILR